MSLDPSYILEAKRVFFFFKENNVVTSQFLLNELTEQRNKRLK